MSKFQWEIAVELAVKYHEGQKYGPYPYVKHLHDVDQLLIKYGFTQPRGNGEQYVKEPLEHYDLLRATAWLHDILEDTSCKISDLLAAGVCKEVVDAVVLLTKTPGYNLADYLNTICTNDIARTIKKWDSWANFEQNVREKNFERGIKYAHQYWVLVEGKWFEPTTIYKAAA